MPAVIAFHALAAGRDDFRSADSKAAAVAVAPVAVDGVGESGASEQRQSKCRNKNFKPMAHDARPPRVVNVERILRYITQSLPPTSSPAPSAACLTRKILCPPSARRHALPIIDEAHMNEAQSSAAGGDPLRAARKIDHPARAVRGLAARAGVRPPGAGAGRPLPLPDRAAAAAFGICDFMHGAAVARAIRVVRACADGGESRRQAENDPGSAQRVASRNPRPRTSARSMPSSASSTRPTA